MCGIAGYLGKRILDSKRVDLCLKSMRHRGPDDEGVYTCKTRDGSNLFLLHTRLSIIDPASRARQPLTYNGGTLCFNGEVYNYPEIRLNLELTGAVFQSEGDTEVLAQLLGRFGMQKISACEGMWAFAWFEHSSGRLHLCRDRFGEKPLYFYEDTDGVYFGSEPKFVFSLLGRMLPINQAQLQRYLVNGYKALYQSNDTFFEGLQEIKPGEYRTYSGTSRENSTYWLPIFDAQDDSMSYSDAVGRVRDSLIKSVELRMRADVPIAFCLSGGVDSNALISIAKKHLGYDVHGFTIMNTDQRYEEKLMVETTVQELELHHTEIYIHKEGFLENLRTLVRCHDAPVYTISYFAQWQLLKAMYEQGYKVSVYGTGADELFSGYFDHHNAYLATIKSQHPDLYADAFRNWTRFVAPIVRNPFLQDPEYFVKQPGCRAHIFLDSDEFSKILESPFFETFSERVYSKDLLRNRMANELRHEVVPVILHEDDLNSMYYSIENRSPYLDTMLFEVAQSIPTRHLIREGRAKAVLRDAVRGLAPSKVIDNPRKVGFNVPLFDYLNVNDVSVRNELLKDSPIYEFINHEGVKALICEDKLSNSRSKFIFNFINAKIFLEEYSLK